MKRFFGFTLVALMLLSTAAMATESRVTAMGPFVAPYIEDDYNVFMWYGTLPSYSNLMMIGMQNDWYYSWNDWEDEIMTYYGLTYALGEDGAYGTLGMLLTHEMRGPNMYGGDVYNALNWYLPEYWDWDDAGIFDNALYNKYTMMYGYAMESMSFGLFFSRSSETDTYESTSGTTSYESEDKDAFTTFGLGARFDIGDNMTADIAFDMTMVSYARGNVDDATTEDANKMMSFRGRMFYEMNDEITLVPYASFNMGDFSLADTTANYYDEAGGFKHSLIKFGIGANLNVNDDNLIVFAVEPFSQFKCEPSTWNSNIEEGMIEIKARTMPRFILALESDLTDWLTFRTGCAKSLMKFTYEYGWTDNERKYTSDSDYFDLFTWNLGLGFHFGDFDIDCVINKDVPFSMGYWLTGFQQNYDNEITPIGMISAIYHF